MLNFQIPDPAAAAHTIVQVTITLDDGAGHRGQATASGPVRDFAVPELTAQAERTTLAAGETTRLQWRASGATFVNISPIVGGPGFPGEGVTEITPCPGTTVFDVWTHNISGEVHVPIPITVASPGRAPWFCGIRSGPSTETWTDSTGVPGSLSGAVRLSAFQSGGRITGVVLAWPDPAPVGCPGERVGREPRRNNPGTAGGRAW